MSLTSDLQAKVRETFRGAWTTRKGLVVPVPTDLKLSNDAIEFDRATVLYADLGGSTNLVDKKIWWFAADVYKIFLHCAATIINKEGGTIVAYDGDRVMAMWLGDPQTTPAARCALKINYAVINIINPILKEIWPGEETVVKHVVGIDTSPIRAARTGVRGDNDLVWVGRAANYAAKLTELDLAERTWLTEAAYGYLLDDLKINGDPPRNMWKKYNWSEHGGIPIYGSTWHWSTG